MKNTTIQCRKKTHAKLVKLKYEQNLGSYDKLLNRLIDYWCDTGGYK